LSRKWGKRGGDFEEDLKKFSGQPKLMEILKSFKDIFGPLPPPGQGPQIVTMDLEFKDE